MRLLVTDIKSLPGGKDAFNDTILVYEKARAAASRENPLQLLEAEHLYHWQHESIQLAVVAYYIEPEPVLVPDNMLWVDCQWVLKELQQFSSEPHYRGMGFDVAISIRESKVAIGEMKLWGNYNYPFRK